MKHVMPTLAQGLIECCKMRPDDPVDFVVSKDPGEWGGEGRDVQLKSSYPSPSFNRPFSKMAAENSNKLKLKTYTSTGKSTFTLVTLQSFSLSGVYQLRKC